MKPRWWFTSTTLLNKMDTNTTEKHAATSPIVSSAKEVVTSALAAFNVGSMYHLEGQGGGGKTSILGKQGELAKAMDIPPERVFVVNCSGYPPSEMVGYGIPDNETHDMWFARPEIWPHVGQVGSDTCLLVLDEFTQWAGEAQSLCRSLFDPNGGPPKIGSHDLGPNVKIAITSNRACDGSRSLRADAPTIGRCLTQTLVTGLDRWLDYVGAKGLGTSPLFAFLKYTQGLNEVDHFNPAIGTRWNGGPYPSPRTWEFALRHTKDLGADASNDPILCQLLQGWVGMKAGSAAFAFIQTVSAFVPRVKAIRKGEDTLPKGDPCAQYSILYAALRTAKKELEGTNPSDAVVGHHVDWLVERFIIPADGELRGWAFRTACAIGIPLEKHDLRSKMQVV